MNLNANALTTLANFKIHMSMQPTASLDDNKMIMYINAASQKIETWCNRILISQSYTELKSGRRQNYLLPDQYPVTAISEIRLDNNRQWTLPQSLLDPTTYTLSDFGQTIQWDGIFPGGYNNIRIIYTAGYVTIPADLELGCIWLAEWYYRNQQRADMGKTTMSKGDESIGILSKTPDMILETLVQYKRSEFINAESPVRNY